jgi:hypothetical protein
MDIKRSREIFKFDGENGEILLTGLSGGAKILMKAGRFEKGRYILYSVPSSYFDLSIISEPASLRRRCG